MPAQVTSLQVEAIGADGACETGGGARGGEANSTVSVTPGETLEVVVGGVGGEALFEAPEPGFNGGGAGGEGGGYAGGGESDVRHRPRACGQRELRG